MPLPGFLRQLSAGLGEKNRAVRQRRDQLGPLQTPNRSNDSDMGDAQAPREIAGPRFAHGRDQIGDDLVLSQVVLALQLPFAMFPLMHFTSRGKFMGKWRNGWFLLATGWSSAVLITLMDVYSLPDAIHDAWRVLHGGP